MVVFAPTKKLKLTNSNNNKYMIKRYQCLCQTCGGEYKSSVPDAELCPTCKNREKLKNKKTFGVDPLYCPKCLSGDLVAKGTLKVGKLRDKVVVVSAHCNGCGQATRVDRLLTQERLNIINNKQ